MSFLIRFPKFFSARVYDMSKENPDPPKWPLRILGWFCKPYYLEVIEGDLIEIFSREAMISGSKAKMRFTWSVFRFFRFRYLKNLEDYQSISSIGMLKNYFKVTLRTMLRQKSYTLFNVIGLASGVAACLLIIMHISYQLTYDKYVPDIDRVYRIVNDWGSTSYNGYTSPRLVKQLKLDYPEIEEGARVMGMWESVIKIEDSYVVQEGTMIADSTFFKIFPTKFYAGTSETALNEPNSVVLTKSVADKLFPDEDAFGKMLNADDEEYQVTGVVEDVPNNSTVPYKVIASMPHEYWVTDGWWTGNSFFSFLKLKENADPQGLRIKFPEFVRQYIAPEMMSYMAGYDSWDDYLADGNYRSLELIPLADVHLHQPRLDLGNGGSYNNIIIFSVVAFFILLIACINYVNMSTARSSLRAKEVGMRKVMGSVRSTIMQQFLVESMMITVISVIIGILLSILILPYFNQLTEMSYTVSNLFSLQNSLWILGLLVLIGLLAGSYPALYLSSFSPITALRGESVRGGSSKMRMGLVIFQFAVSIFLITGTIIVYQQVSHMTKRNLGLNSEQVFVLTGGNKIKDQLNTFRTELISNSNIAEMGVVSNYPSGMIPDWNYQTTGENAITLSPDHVFSDEYAMQALGMELVEGKFFSGIATDTAAVLVNEKFVSMAGWDDAIGQIVERGGGENYRVIGVVKDVVLRTGGRNIRPGLYRYSKAEDMSGGTYMLMKVSGNYQEAIKKIEATWDQFVPGYPFDGFFLDDSFDRLYNSERRFGKVFTTFSGLAILIASIGLFALAAFTLERRMKEIAIRKVLGATVTKVVTIIIWDFLKLIIIGSIIAIPVVIYLGNNWLENYDYRITIDPILIIVPILLVSLMAILTIGYKSYVTATDNPVNALKQE